MRVYIIYFTFQLSCLYSISQNCNDYRRSSDSVIVNNCADYTIYESKGYKVYFSYWFQTGFLGIGDSLENYIDYYNYQISTIGRYFKDGSITGKMFHENGNGHDSIIRLTAPMDSLFIEFDSAEKYDENITKILNFEIKSISKDLDTVQVEIWATNSIWESGWGSFGVYLLVLFNKDGKEGMTWDEYFEKAKALCFKYSYTQI
jgi:hypothetical protein